MKKLLLLITGLLLLFSAEGQILRYSNYTAPTPPEEDEYYSEYQTVYNAFGTEPHDTIADLQEALVYSLDTAGYWDKMDVFYVFASHNGTDALINWVNPGTYDATNVSETSFTQWEGFTGDGTADYINTNLSLADEGLNTSMNDVAFGIYINNNIQSGGYAFGTNTTGSHAVYFRPRGTDNVLYYKINQSAATTVNPNTDSEGFFIITRTASNVTHAYKDGSSLGGATNSSTQINDLDIFILARNDSGSAAGFAAFSVAIFFIMNEVVQDDVTAINTIISTYIDSIQ